MDEPRPDMTDPTRTDSVILPSLETPTLTKAELAELLFDRIGLNKRESKDIVEAFFDLLHEALVTGHRGQAVGLRQLLDPREGLASGPQPAHRRVGADQGAQRRDLSFEPQAQGDCPRRDPAARRVRVKSEPHSEDR